METKQKHAGGRPKLPTEQKLIQRSIRLSSEQWAKIDKFGLTWLRTVIQRAQPPRDSGSQPED